MSEATSWRGHRAAADLPESTERTGDSRLRLGAQARDWGASVALGAQEGIRGPGGTGGAGGGLGGGPRWGYRGLVVA